MDILVEIDDEVLLQLLLMAKGHRRSLNQEIWANASPTRYSI
jgi:hypothetical protein